MSGAVRPTLNGTANLLYGSVRLRLMPSASAWEKAGNPGSNSPQATSRFREG